MARWRPCDAVPSSTRSTWRSRFSRPGWERAVELIEDCKVKSVSQTHSLIVELSLKDGGTHTTTEPHSDAVFDEIAKASHCPPLESIAIE